MRQDLVLSKLTLEGDSLLNQHNQPETVSAA